jgi:hypothetical protein
VNETEQEKRRSLEIFHSWDWPESQVSQFIAADTEKWAKVVKFAGIKLQ